MKTLLVAGLLCLGLVACADVPGRSPALARADGDAHVTIRAQGGRLWWSYQPWTEPHALWALPGHGEVEDLSVRAIASDSEDPTFVVSFRQGGTTYRGRFAVDATVDAPGAYLHADRDDVGDLAMQSDLARGGR